MYEDVNHDFHNGTTPHYDEQSASLVWKWTTALFKKQLVGHDERSSPKLSLTFFYIFGLQAFIV